MPPPPSALDRNLAFRIVEIGYHDKFGAMDELAKANELIPRRYQEELFQRAQQENIIATMDTGSGKTFIAALLIKWIMSLESTRDKKVVFLVPKVPLVDQQRDFLDQQTPLEVRGYKGAMGVDDWDARKWGKEFSESDVLVMTGTVTQAHVFLSI